MALVTQAAALCVIAALLGLVLRRSNPEITLLLALAAAAAVLLALAEPLTELLRFLERLAEQSGVSRTLLTPLYKTVGIALVVKVGGGLCRDAGESALAAALEFAGTVCALLTALPLLRAVLELITELLLFGTGPPAADAPGPECGAAAGGGAGAAPRGRSAFEGCGPLGRKQLSGGALRHLEPPPKRREHRFAA